MWDSFAKALNKRAVKDNNNICFDKHCVIKAAQVVLVDMFGLLGRDNFEVVDFYCGKLKIKSTSPVWSCEIRLKKGVIKDKINSKLGQQAVGDLVLYSQ